MKKEMLETRETAETEEEKMFELTWDSISKNKANQHAKNIKASHEVRGDMVEGDFDFE